MTFEATLAAIVGRHHVQPEAPLAPLTTFKVGGPADWLVDATTVEELQGVVAAARAANVPVTVLGGGSNLLVGDRGVRGVVIRVRFLEIGRDSETRIRAGAGVTINGLVRWTIGHALSGLEAWAGTPGTVGGAIYGNAHYGGRNIGDLVADVGLVTLAGEFWIARAAEMEFAYDRSRLQRTHEIVVWAAFHVQAIADEGDRNARVSELREIARSSLAHRKRTQPLDTPSAGCIFQNPDPALVAIPQDVPASAGALVDRAGLKGDRIGGARISPTHANFILNDGDATARDIRALIDKAREAVRDRFGVDLREEVVSIGEFGNV